MIPVSVKPCVIEILGEGITDSAAKIDAAPVPPIQGVLTVLVHRLCESPETMMVLRRPFRFLQGKGLGQKANFFKRNAKINGSVGCVFVMDTEGEHKRVLGELTKGRDADGTNFPMAIGVAHPCIESWLLSDATAIKRGLNISKPNIPPDPESLPAPRKDRKNNPKVSLKAACGGETNAAKKTEIARSLTLATSEQICPSFKAFAEEVREHIKPLFANPIPEPHSTDLA